MIEGALKADGRLAAKNAVKIRAALHQVTDFKRVFDKYQETQPQPTDNPTQDRVRARSWILLNIYLNDEPLRLAVIRAWKEAFILGDVAAQEWLRKTREANKADDIEVNWDNWKPGDVNTALNLKNFEAYLTVVNADSYFKKFNKETIVNLGTALSDSIALGLDAESAAVMIGKHVASPSRALTIAITEQNRAMSFSSIARYKEAGLQKMEWAVSDPCDVCAKNDGQVIVIGQTFASGDAQPPAHPHCRCVLLPVIPGMEDEPEIPGVTMVTPPSPVDFGPDATTFRTPKEEIEQVVAALQQGRSLNEALDMYEALDARPYVPGQWEILPQILNRQAAISSLGRALIYPMPREQIERTFFASNTIKKVDRAFIEKAVIYKNGPLEVQFSSTGLTLTEAERKLVIKEVEKLQATNPKTRVAVHIDKNASGKYGWAYGGKQDLWVTPRTIKDPVRKDGTFKMPATPETTQFQYTLAHEWGHLIDDITQGTQNAQRTNAILRLKSEYPNAFKSGYSAENTKEFFAEMFTEYYRTNGTTPNLLVQAMAKEFGWKVPKISEIKVNSEMPYPWNPTLKYTKQEEFLNQENYKIQAKDLQAAAAAPLSMRMNRDTLKAIIKDKKFKSLNEVETNFGGRFKIGETYRQNRKSLENGTWGIPENAQQPIYGYMDQKITIHRTTGNTFQEPSVTAYGDIQIILKDEIKNRTTITLGDSLNTKRTPVQINEALAGNLSNAQVSSAVDIGAYDYYEAQIHGGLSITDIKEIRLNGSTVSAAEKQALLENGIIINE